MNGSIAGGSVNSHSTNGFIHSRPHKRRRVKKMPGPDPILLEQRKQLPIWKGRRDADASHSKIN
jgi:hypothetical protein